MFSQKAQQSSTPDFAFVRRKDAHSGSSAGADSPCPVGAGVDDTPTIMRKTMLSPPSPAEEPPTRVAAATAVVKGWPWSAALAVTLALTILACTVLLPRLPASRRELAVEDPSAALVQAMSAELQKLREDHRAELATLRTDHRAELAVLRDDLTKQIGELRSAVDHVFGGASGSSQAKPSRVSGSSATSVLAKMAFTRPSAAAAVAPPPAPPSPVHVWFIFDVSEHLGASVELYWLMANATERHYATIPAGQRVDETTLPGECWRARTPSSASFRGHDLLTYCATTATNQYVNIVPHEHVHVDLHFPRSQAMPRSANIYSVQTVGGQQAEMLLGPLAQGAHLYFDAKAGGRFVARNLLTRALLLEGSIGYEEDQYFDLSSSNVTFELELDVAAQEPVEVFWVSRGEHAPPTAPTPVGGPPAEAQATDVEQFHFHAEVSRPGEVLTVSSTAGEEWVVRRKHEPYDKVFGITLVDDPEVHRHVIVVPPRAPPPRSPP